MGLTRKGGLYAAQIFIGDRQPRAVEVIVDTGRTDTAIVLPLPNFSRKPSYHGVALEDKVELGGHLVQQRFWSRSGLSIELGDEHESNVEG